VLLAAAVARLVSEPARIREYPVPSLPPRGRRDRAHLPHRGAGDRPWIGRIVLVLAAAGGIGAALGAAFDALVRGTAPRGLGASLVRSGASGGWPPSPAALLAAPSPLTRYAAFALAPLAFVLWARSSAEYRDPARIERESSLLRGFDPREEELYAWIRDHTTKEARFLQPPLLERFRLTARRAVVVDWKSPPILPGELLEWYDRLGAVAGRPRPRGASEVGKGYDAMDAARLTTLRDRYAVDNAVVRRGREASLSRWPTVYSNEATSCSISGPDLTSERRESRIGRAARGARTPGAIRANSDPRRWSNLAVATPRLSFVIPFLNEAATLAELHARIAAAVGAVLGPGEAFEVVFVDDGSTDDSVRVVEALVASHPEVSLVELQGNFGKSAALAAGFAVAQGEVVFTLDADLQDDPKESPASSRSSTVATTSCPASSARATTRGTRSSPPDLQRMVRMSTGIRLHDVNCGFKAYRRRVLENVRVYGELHRFVPVLAHWRRFKVGEIEVEHHARVHGVSKFGSGRFSAA
jgi:hypothetical protein